MAQTISAIIEKKLHDIGCYGLSAYKICQPIEDILINSNVSYNCYIDILILEGKRVIRQLFFTVYTHSVHFLHMIRQITPVPKIIPPATPRPIKREVTPEALTAPIAIPLTPMVNLVISMSRVERRRKEEEEEEEGEG